MEQLLKMQTKNELMQLRRKKDFIKYIQSIGYQQVKNSNAHMIYKCNGKSILSIPNHSKEIATGTLRNLIKLILNENYYN